MPSSYSPRLRFELQATGENRSTWGVKANNDFSLIEFAIAGSTSIAMADADVTLTTANGTTDQARSAILIFTGALTAARTITAPAVSKAYIIKNATTGGFSLTVKTTSVGGLTATVQAGTTALIYTDGTDTYVSGIAQSAIDALQSSINGKEIISVYAAKAGNYTAVAGDTNAIHRFTAAATLSLTAAATLGTNWHYTLVADGGAVTIDPNGSELINGLATATIPQGGTASIVCDGSAFYTYVKPSAWEPIGAPITLSGQSSVSWTNLTAYRHLKLTLSYIPSPGTGNVLLRVSTDNGSSYISTSTYSSASLVQTGATVTGTGGSASTAMIVSNTTVDANSGFLSTTDISNFNKSAPSSYKVVSEYANTNPRIDFIYGGHGGTTARNALQLLVTSGSFTAGMVLLEGLRG